MSTRRPPPVTVAEHLQALWEEIELLREQEQARDEIIRNIIRRLYEVEQMLDTAPTQELRHDE
jgi:hypothetical protein